MEKEINEQFMKLNYIIGDLDSLYHSAALKFGLTDSAMAVIYAIRAEGRPCRISEICRLMGVSRQTANSALRRLENDGLIRLEAVDGKQKSAALTERGMALSETTAARIIAAENRVFSSWTEAERSEFLRLNRKLCEQLKIEFDKLG